MRLTNRIKLLELNMTLSSQYLEKLSQHYKKQMDEMQKAFNYTTWALTNATRLASEREEKLQERIRFLEKHVDNMQLVIDLLNASAIESEFRTQIIMYALAIIICTFIIVQIIGCANRSLNVKMKAFEDEAAKKKANNNNSNNSSSSDKIMTLSRKDLEELIKCRIETALNERKRNDSELTSNGKVEQVDDSQSTSSVLTASSESISSLDIVEEIKDQQHQQQQQHQMDELEEISKQNELKNAAAVMSSTLTAVVATISLAAAAKASCAANLPSTGSEELDR